MIAVPSKTVWYFPNSTNPLFGSRSDCKCWSWTLATPISHAGAPSGRAVMKETNADISRMWSEYCMLSVARSVCKFRNYVLGLWTTRGRRRRIEYSYIVYSLWSVVVVELLPETPYAETYTKIGHFNRVNPEPKFVIYRLSPSPGRHKTSGTGTGISIIVRFIMVQKRFHEILIQYSSAATSTFLSCMINIADKCKWFVQMQGEF